MASLTVRLICGAAGVAAGCGCTGRSAGTWAHAPRTATHATNHHERTCMFTSTRCRAHERHELAFEGVEVFVAEHHAAAEHVRVCVERVAAGRHRDALHDAVLDEQIDDVLVD